MGQVFPNLTYGTVVMGTSHHLSKPVLIGARPVPRRHGAARAGFLGGGPPATMRRLLPVLLVIAGPASALETRLQSSPITARSGWTRG